MTSGCGLHRLRSSSLWSASYRSKGILGRSETLARKFYTSKSTYPGIIRSQATYCSGGWCSTGCRKGVFCWAIFCCKGCCWRSCWSAGRKHIRVLYIISPRLYCLFHCADNTKFLTRNHRPWWTFTHLHPSNAYFDYTGYKHIEPRVTLLSFVPSTFSKESVWSEDPDPLAD